METILAFLVVLFIALGMTALISLVAQILINAIFRPEVLVVFFGVPQIGYWTTFGLVILCTILFKSNVVSTQKKNE